MSKATVTGFYGHDHDELDNYLKEFQALKHKDFSKAKPFFRAFKTGLLRHILWEEEILFPVFEAKMGMKEGGPTAVMRHEHAQIKEILEALHQKVRRQEPDSDEGEQALIAILEAHNQKEEMILYPAIDGLTSPQEKEALFKQMQEFPKERYDNCGCGH